MLCSSRIDESFFQNDVLEVAPALLGQYLCKKSPGGTERFRITEVEAYRGEEDLACHACKGKTSRTEIMYRKGGYLYVYLIYGIHWMLNIVTGEEDQPQAALIRGVEGISGPGRVTRRLDIDKSCNGENLVHSEKLWLEKGNPVLVYKSLSRIGIDYAGEPWRSILWRFTVNNL